MLTIIETVQAGEVTAVTAAKNGTKPKRKVVVLGNATLTLSAGQTDTTQLGLNGTGKRLLAEYHALKVKLAITESGKTISTKSLTSKAKPKRRKH